MSELALDERSADERSADERSAVEPAVTSRLRRALEGAGFVGLWMALGWSLHLNTELYQAVGVPLTLAFQVGIRRRPVRSLWVRSAPPLRLDRSTLVVTATLAFVPGCALVLALGTRDVGGTLMGLGGVAGSLAAAYALRQFRRETVRSLLLCLATSGIIGLAVFLMPWFARAVHGQPHGFKPMAMLLSFVWYLPIGCVFEEVSMRGALDSHLHHPGESRPWLSALYVSVLWGLWHLPIVAPAMQNVAVTALHLILFHSLVGIGLSLFWRKSGNLMVPAAVHALLDAVRDGLAVV